MKNKNALYTIGEEIFNSVTHGVGTLISIAALVLLVVFAAISPAPLLGYRVVSAAIYGSTMIILYLSSTLYHALTPPIAKGIFRIFDHCSIYLLIAGTYTPISLVALNGVAGWVVFGIIWGCAVLGIVLDACPVKKPRWFSMVLYLLMGWMIVLYIRPVIEFVGSAGTWLIVAGGISYTVGAIFYGLTKIKWMHSVWHLFVLAGTVFHFLAILLFIIK